MNINDCKGCESESHAYTVYKKYTLCGILYRQKLKEFEVPICPCVECLIKMVCAKGCDSYAAYMSMVYKSGITNLDRNR
jgi:hypothetical protein